MTHTETIKVSQVQKALFTELQQLNISAETIRFLGFVQELEPGKLATSLTHHICELAMRADHEPGQLFTNKEMAYYLRLQQFLLIWQEDVNEDRDWQKKAG